MSSFKLTAKQQEAQHLIASSATHIMLFGGSRSGKTFLHVRNIVMRALKAPGSRHAILRFRFNHVKISIVRDTFPKVMKIAFPGVEWHLDKTDWFVKFPNGSEIWFGGLDDKERTEKILGQEHATIYLNECSQIPQVSRDMAITRAAQLVNQEMENRPPVPLKTRVYYDCNPPPKSHWTYKIFVAKVDPETGKPLTNPQDYVSIQMNPQDNAENIADNYLDTLKSLSPRLQRRFLLGEFADANPNALFTDEQFDKWRVIDEPLPDMVRIVVAVDPSGSDDKDNEGNDAIGIIIAGLGTDGNAYIMEDCTVNAGPATWGKVATTGYDRHEADTIVGEENFGGAMVKFVIQTARPRTPYKSVRASRGKVVRAEPISALYEQGRVRHVGYLTELEDELAAFSTTGYTGARSPNRADAAIWALTELFPSIVSEKKAKKEYKPQPVRIGSGGSGWMGV